MTCTKEQIQLTPIGEALTRLWEKEKGENKIRASLFNFILYARKTKEDSYYQELIKSIVSKFPCRVIMVLEEEDAQYLHTHVHFETLSQGSLQVFCEIIQIEVAGSLIERVPFLILPHILPDLPVFLLWTQDPSTEHAILPHLEPFADRIIFDSDSTPDLQNYSHAVLSLMRRFHAQISDLNWSALSGWRQVFRTVFNTPSTLSDLQHCKRIRIHYNQYPSESQKHRETEATYFQAWLATRLEWKFISLERSANSIRLMYRHNTETVEILLVPQDIENLKRGSLISMEIEGDQNKAQYRFERLFGAQQVSVHYSDKNRCDLPFTCYLPGLLVGQEIIQELFYPSLGVHYKEILKLLSEIPWQKK